ncbi:MAG: GNAT family N-acetyltransferase [Sphingobium sp.]|nr:N-acetyltransferase [Sphingobium sp.]MCP5398838.1 N-acetyltransferase [Sphingomonas sp.]
MSLENHEIEAVLDAAFGPDRHRRTAYAIRKGMLWLPEYSYAARDDAGNVLGVLQSWPVELRSDDGTATPLIMVGPVAVVPSDQKNGIGKAMMDRLVADTDLSAKAHLMMIGDPEYYGRFWRFLADDTSGWRAPGPVDPRRLLMRQVPGIEPLPRLSGMLAPRSA